MYESRLLSWDASVPRIVEDSPAYPFHNARSFYSATAQLGYVSGSL